MSKRLENYIDSILKSGLEKDYWFMTKQTMSDFYLIFMIGKVVETYPQNKLSNENFGQYYQRFFKEAPFLRNKYPKQAESEYPYRNSLIA